MIWVMKTILITGSARGIGNATAKLAAKQGYRVILHGRTESEHLSKAQKEIPGSEKTFFDISDKEAVMKAITKLGDIDVLVNDAGLGRAGITDISEVDDDQAVIEYKTNVLGTLHCIQAVYCLE